MLTRPMQFNPNACQTSQNEKKLPKWVAKSHPSTKKLHIRSQVNEKNVIANTMPKIAICNHATLINWRGRNAAHPVETAGGSGRAALGASRGVSRTVQRRIRSCSGTNITAELKPRNYCRPGRAKTQRFSRCPHVARMPSSRPQINNRMRQVDPLARLKVPLAGAEALREQLLVRMRAAYLTQKQLTRQVERRVG
jgi:hypothetical protein